MKVVFATSALKDYRDFEQKDSKVFKRINRLLKNIKETPFDGLGKPEPLKHNWTGARIKDSPVVAKHDEHAANFRLCARMRCVETNHSRTSLGIQSCRRSDIRCSM